MLLVIIIKYLMLKNRGLAILALSAAVSAKSCYSFIGTYSNSDDGDVDIGFTPCWTKDFDKGALGTGTGLIEFDEKRPTSFTITTALISGNVLTMWGKLKDGKTTRIFSAMCEFDEDMNCSGYYAQQPDISGTLWLEND